MESVRDILTIAARTGELVSIVYHGGSRPGSARDVRPIAVTSNDLRAEDIAAGAVKTFILSKIEIARSDTKLTYDPNATPVEDTRSIREIFAPKVGELQSMGWSVELTANAIQLHSYFKNGKVCKGVVIGLSFDEFVTESYLDDDTFEPVEEQRKSKRPYHVFGPSYAAGSGFAHLQGAAAVFMEQAQKHSASVAGSH